MRSLLFAAAAAGAVAILAPSSANADLLARSAPNAPAPAIELVRTDTVEAIPFADLAVNGNLLHVTVGDKLYGVHVVVITEKAVVLSDLRVLRLRDHDVAAMRSPR